jgi:hypothetical protein
MGRNGMTKIGGGKSEKNKGTSDEGDGKKVKG